MKRYRSGLIVEITDVKDYNYRGNLYYSLATDLAGYNSTALFLTSGFLPSETILELFGALEQKWREGASTDPHFLASESPAFI
jgi:hypothetical protein